jgi:hypothetical protein
MREYFVAWWNVENLFDEETLKILTGAPMFRAIKDDIAGWTPALRDKKIDQLATVIAAMNTWRRTRPTRRVRDREPLRPRGAR